MKRKRRHLTAEFKAQAVELISTGSPMSQFEAKNFLLTKQKRSKNRLHLKHIFPFFHFSFLLFKFPLYPPMLRAILRNSGIHPRRIRSSLTGWRRYATERASFRKMPGADALPWGRELPILTEWVESSGSLGAYFYQDQLVAQWIHGAKPNRHLDVGSRLDGFIGSLSVFREVEVIDIRPQPRPVRNVSFHQIDLMDELPLQWIESTDSLSCLHTI